MANLKLDINLFFI